MADIIQNLSPAFGQASAEKSVNLKKCNEKVNEKRVFGMKKEMADTVNTQAVTRAHAQTHT